MTMNKYIFPVYRLLVPKPLRTIILKKTLRKNILKYFSSLPSDKVEIINKYVSDHDDESHIRFDTFFRKNNDINFLKIDVDGAESKVLESCDRIFSTDKSFKVALCTYHKNHDEDEFTRFLKSHRFNVTPSQGYMIHYYDKRMKAPYLRRGLIRATR